MQPLLTARARCPGEASAPDLPQPALCLGLIPLTWAPAPPAPALTPAPPRPAPPRPAPPQTLTLKSELLVEDSRTRNNTYTYTYYHIYRNMYKVMERATSGVVDINWGSVSTGPGTAAACGAHGAVLAQSCLTWSCCAVRLPDQPPRAATLDNPHRPPPPSPTPPHPTPPHCSRLARLAGAGVREGWRAVR